jgi:hypothetical protein
VVGITPKSGAEKLIYSFCSLIACADGNDPESGVFNVGRTLYGATYGGGAYAFKTVFKIESS